MFRYINAVKPGAKVDDRPFAAVDEKARMHGTIGRIIAIAETEAGARRASRGQKHVRIVQLRYADAKHEVGDHLSWPQIVPQSINPFHN